MATGQMATERPILKGNRMFSSFAVKDIEAARRFYGDELGLDVRDSVEPGLLEIHGSDDSPIMVYPKPDHQPAVFTVLNFLVRDLESTVAALTAAGIRMEHYDGNDGPKTDAKGIARDSGGPAIAWFTDPSGNILSVLEGDRS
jgi:catechol 2,3-dioxygenase-like lactoylglutathione lyase family enzyme